MYAVVVELHFNFLPSINKWALIDNWVLQKKTKFVQPFYHKHHITVINRPIHNTWVQLWFGMMIDPSYAWPKMRRSEGRRSFRQSRLIWIWALKRAVKSSRTDVRKDLLCQNNSKFQLAERFRIYDLWLIVRYLFYWNVQWGVPRFSISYEC